MPTEVQSGLSVAWRDGTQVQSSLSAAWRDATGVQSIGSGYVVPTVPGGVPVPPGGSLTPRYEVLPSAYYAVPHTLAVTDLRDAAALPVDRVQIQLQDGSTHHTCTLQGPPPLADALRAGDQPAQFKVLLGADEWHMLVEEIDQPRAFARGDVTVRARSLAALADAPTQADQQWQVDAPTTAAQLATLAQTFTGLTVDWQAGDWLLPAGAWSYTGNPLGLVRALAQAIGADVIADRAGYGVTVRARYEQAPQLWAMTAPDWQVPLAAVESVQQQRADTPEYDGLVVAGPRTGDVLQARLAGTSGGRQAPMVTDPALTDVDALRLRADATLLSYGKQVRDTRALQIHGGRAIREGQLVRWVDDDKTWAGVVRSYSIEAGLASATQTVTCERRTAWITGTVVPPPVLTTPQPEWENVLLLLRFDEAAGATQFQDSSLRRAVFNGSPGLPPCVTSSAAARFGNSAFLPAGVNSAGNISAIYRFSPTSTFNFLTNDFSVEFEVLLPAAGNSVLLKGGNVSIRMTTTGVSAYLTPSGGAAVILADTSGALPTSQFVHIALCRQAGVARLFVNGVLKAQAAAAFAMTMEPDFGLGGYEEIGFPGGSGNRYYDEVRVVGGQAIYTADFARPTEPHPWVPPPPSLTLTAPAPGTVGIAAPGGVVALVDGVAPVSFTLTSTPAATITPASGVVSPGTPVSYTVTAATATTHTITLTNTAGITNPPAVSYTAAAAAVPVLLNFTGVGHFAALNNFYNGGTDSAGNAGTNRGIAFTSAGLGYNTTTGGSLIANPPSSPMVLFFSGSPAFLNRSAGFTGLLSIKYSTRTDPYTITVHSEVDGGGSTLATLTLNALGSDPITGGWSNWATATATITGTAKSINFVNAADQVAFDDIQFETLL